MMAPHEERRPRAKETAFAKHSTAIKTSDLSLARTSAMVEEDRKRRLVRDLHRVADTLRVIDPTSAALPRSWASEVFA